MNPFGDDVSEQEADNFTKFSINKGFKDRYEHNERRKFLEQGKLKYGDLIHGDDEESSESESDEDSQGDLITDKVQSKTLQTLLAIRKGDKSILEQANGGTIFVDDDFEEPEQSLKEKSKKFTLKDQERTYA